jgi:hypothetical protein
MAEEKPDALESTAQVEDPGVHVAFGGPAPFANKIYITMTPVTGRLSFLEFSDQGVPHFRTAVTLTVNDLVALRDLLIVTLKDIQLLPTAKPGS